MYSFIEYMQTCEAAEIHFYMRTSCDFEHPQRMHERACVCPTSAIADIVLAPHEDVDNNWLKKCAFDAAVNCWGWVGGGGGEW